MNEKATSQSEERVGDIGRIMPDLPIVLGSASVYRAEVLRSMDIPFTVRTVDIDEKAIRHSDPCVTVELIAKAKAEAIIPMLDEPCFLATGDQVAVFQGEVREKPKDADQAREWLREYRGDVVHFLTALHVIDTSTGRTRSAVRGVKLAVCSHYDNDDIEAAIADGTVLTTCGGVVRESTLFSRQVLSDSNVSPASQELESTLLGLPVLTLCNFLVELNGFVL